MATPQVSRMDLQVYGMSTQICRMTIKMRMTEKGLDRYFLVSPKSQSISSFFTTFYCLLESIMISSLMMPHGRKICHNGCRQKSAVIFR